MDLAPVFASAHFPPDSLAYRIDMKCWDRQVQALGDGGC